MLDALASTFDSAERTALYKSLQMNIMKVHTFVPLFFGTRMSGFWGPRTLHVPPHPMGSHTGFETVEMARTP